MAKAMHLPKVIKNEDDLKAFCYWLQANPEIRQINHIRIQHKVTGSFAFIEYPDGIMQTLMSNFSRMEIHICTLNQWIKNYLANYDLDAAAPESVQMAARFVIQFFKDQDYGPALELLKSSFVFATDDLSVETYYDRSIRSYVTMTKNKLGDQIGICQYAGTKITAATNHAFAILKAQEIENQL